MGNTKSRQHILTPEQMQEYKEIGNFTERQVYLYLDSFYEDYPSGTIDKETFVRENSTTHAGTQQMWNHIFDQLDKNGDGCLDFKEFLTCIAIGTSSSNEEKLLFAFKIFDIGGDGYIDYYEFSQLYHFIFGNLKEGEETAETEDKELGEKCRSLFETLDANSQDGKLSMPEFVHGLKNDPVMIVALTIF